MTFKRWIVVVLAALAGAGAWWMQRSPWLSASLRAPIENALAKASGRSVSLGGVGGGLSGWLWLHDLSIGPQPGGQPWDVSFTAQEVGLRLDAWALLHGRADLSSLRELQAVAPRLFVLQGPAGPGQPQALSAAAQADPAAAWSRLLSGLPLPPVPMDISRGEVWERPLPGGDPAAPAERLIVGELHASLAPLPGGGWKLRASGRPAGKGEASLSAECGPSFSKPRAFGQFKDLEWPDWLPLPPGISRLQGRFKGDFEARPRAGAWPLGLGLAGRGEIEGGALRADPARPGLSGLGLRWTLTDGQLSVDALSAAYAGGRIQGQARVDLAASSFSATVTAQGTDLGQLALSAGAPPDLQLSGASDLDLWAAGPVSAPALTVELRSQAARWRAHPLTSIAMKASGAGSRWQGDGTLAWDGGQGRLSLALDQGALQGASLEVSALPADWLDAWVGEGVTGRLDGEGRFGGGRGPWKLALRGAHLSVRGSAVDHASLQASGGAGVAHLRLAADLPGRVGLSGEADATKRMAGSWFLRSAKLFQNGRLLLQAGGQWQPGGPAQAAALSLSVTTSSLDLDLLAPALKSQGWSGSVQGSGQVRFAGGAWSGELQARAPNLSRRNWALGADGGILFGPAGITLSALTLRGGEIAGTAFAPRWSGPWTASLTLTHARLAALAALSDAVPQGLSGVASGRLAYASEAPRRLDASLDVQDPLPALLPGAAGHLDLRGEGPRWDLRSLSLTQPGGGHAEGEAGLDLSGKTPWTGKVRWSGLRLRGMTLAGEARLQGGAGQAGGLRLAPWSLSATALPALDASFHFGDEGLSAAEGGFGPGVQWALRRTDGVWSGQAELAHEDPGALAGFLFGKAGYTALRVNGTVEGALASVSRPAYVRLSLSEEGGGFLKAQGRWNAGRADVDGSFKGLKLGRFAAAAKALGAAAPALEGTASGSLHGEGAALSVTASVDALSLNKNKLGPASFKGGWDGASAWIASATLGPDAGPQVAVTDAQWRRGAEGWTAGGTLRVKDWPLAILDLGADADLTLSGKHGHVEGEAQFRQLVVGNRVWQKLALGGTWDGLRYSVKERSRRPAFTASGTAGGGAFTIDALQAFSGRGQGRLSGKVAKDRSLNFDGSSSGLPASDLAGIMGWPQDWTGSAWGTLKVSGALDHVHTVVSAKVEDGSVQGLPFDLGTGIVVQDGNWVDLSSLAPIRISRHDGTALEVGGKVTLLDDPPPGEGMDVWAESKMGGLRLFAGLPAIHAADGPLTLKLRFTGKPSDPRVDGTFRLDGGSVDPAWLLPPLDHADILAQIKDSKLFLQKAEARVRGDGPLLRIEAADPLKPAFVFKAWVPADMNLRIRASKSGLPVRNTRAMSFVSGLVHPDLVFSGSWTAPVLSGSVVLEKGGQDKAVVQWPPQFESPSKPGEQSWFDRLNYDLALKARTDVMVRTGAAEVFVDTGDAGVMMRGAGERRALSGHIRLVQGNVDYLLATFRLAQDHDSWVDMRGEEDPVVELWGIDDLGSVTLSGEGAPRDVQVLLHAWGPLGTVQMRLSEEDDPSLTQDQLAALLGLGGGVGDPGSQGGFTRMLGAVPAGYLSTWGRKTGLVDVVGLRLPAVEEAIAGPTPGAGDTGQVEPQSATTPTTATAKSLVEVSVGKYVGSKIFVGVNTEVMAHTDPLNRTSYDPEMGGVVEYQLPGSSKLSVQHSLDSSGETDNRVMLEGSTRFDNYNPSRRRWDGSPTPTPPSGPSVALPGQGASPEGAPELGASPSPSPTPPSAQSQPLPAGSLSGEPSFR